MILGAKITLPLLLDEYNILNNLRQLIIYFFIEHSILTYFVEKNEFKEYREQNK